MITEQHAGSKRPVAAILAGPYGHPFHPILVTIPIGAWVTSLVFDIASRLASHPDFQAPASRWLIGLGVIGAVAAASVGFLDFLTLAPHTPAHRTAVVHLTLNVLVTAAYAGNFLWRHAAMDHDRVTLGQLLLSVASLLALAAAGTLGGRLAYHYGVRVAEETTQAQGFQRTTATAAASDATAPASPASPAAPTGPAPPPDAGN